MWWIWEGQINLQYDTSDFDKKIAQYSSAWFLHHTVDSIDEPDLMKFNVRKQTLSVIEAKNEGIKFW